MKLKTKIHLFSTLLMLIILILDKYRDLFRIRKNGL